MCRRLLNIASIICLVLCVALIGMWVRSYFYWDALHGRFTDKKGFQISVLPGQLCFLTLTLHQPKVSTDWPRRVSIDLTSNFSKSLLPPDDDDDEETPQKWRWQFQSALKRSCCRSGWIDSSLGFAAMTSSNLHVIVVPIWFLVLVIGVPGLMFCRLGRGSSALAVYSC